ncbi:MAG: glycine cleavage system protein R [Candidatus Sumerlaeaceae bacterium]
MSEKEHVIVTSVGSDRPGIVAELSGWILENGGNIEDSRMSQLGGEFATLVLVSGDTGLAQKLESAREQFASQCGQTISSKPVAAAPSAPAISHLRYQLKATALDHPGIVHQVSQLLREQSVNIVSASTHTTPAPFTGAPVFQFQMLVDVPGTTTAAKLRDQLRELGDRDNIDFTLTAAE